MQTDRSLIGGFLFYLIKKSNQKINRNYFNHFYKDIEKILISKGLSKPSVSDFINKIKQGEMPKNSPENKVKSIICSFKKCGSSQVERTIIIILNSPEGKIMRITHNTKFYYDELPDEIRNIILLNKSDENLFKIF